MTDKEKNVDKKALELEEMFSAKLSEMKDGLEKSFEDKLEAKFKKDTSFKVFVAEDTQKDISELTSEEKVKAYSYALFTGDEATLKALSEGVPADGGFTVPQDFYNALLEELEEQSVMRSMVTVVPMNTNVLTLTEGGDGPEVYWTAEGATKTTTTMEFTQPTITAYKLAAIIYMTDELMDDSAFDLTQVLVRRFAMKMAQAEEKAIIAGTGVGQPTGIFVDANVAARAVAGNLSFDNIIDLIYDLPVRYRRNARFIVHNNNVRELRKIKDNDGRYLWQDPVSAGQPATIQGYPVIETYDCPESEIAFGDYREGYWLGDRQRMTVKITNDTETTFTQDKTAIRVVQRIGGTVVFPQAIKKLNNIP